jgi:hypothetical protein
VKEKCPLEENWYFIKISEGISDRRAYGGSGKKPCLPSQHQKIYMISKWVFAVLFLLYHAFETFH